MRPIFAVISAAFIAFLSSMIVELKSSTSRFYCDFVRVQQKRKNYAQVYATSSNVFTNYLWAVLTFVLINFVFVLTKRENVLNVFKCAIPTNSNKKRLNVRNCRWRVKTLERVFPQNLHGRRMYCTTRGPRPHFRQRASTIWRQRLDDPLYIAKIFSCCFAPINLVR